MAVASANAAERINLSSPMDASATASPSRSPSDLVSESSAAPCTPDRAGSSSPSPGRDAEVQSLSSQRSEEYRQLFRLPPEEVLVQDFNCAIQESILIQGHLYIFLRYVCFYSNIFGYETKKIIPFQEITSVKRAKTAGIFPNAIEILAGGRKYFFASFLSRDEALKLIEDGCLQQDDGAKEITEQQESISCSNSQDNGISFEKVDSSKQVIENVDSSRQVIENVDSSKQVIEKIGSFKQVIEKVDSFKEVIEIDSTDGHNSTALDNSNSSPHVENGAVLGAELQDNIENNVLPVRSTDPSSLPKNWTWNVEDSDAPEISKSYTNVAESKFPIKVEEFFNLFFSDDAITFVESFHKRCGDKEFRCSLWNSHEKFGHARNVSFQHPIKIYFGAKFGSCQEVQKFRIYRNSHLVIETSQEINDVPYGDYFRVEGLWDVVRDGDESNGRCILQIYVDVAFSKKTVFKGKIVQSTLEECREAYATWINMAHELLKQKNLEKQEEESRTANLIQNGEVHPGSQLSTVEVSQRATDDMRKREMSGSMNANQRVGNILPGNFVNNTKSLPLLGEYLQRFFSFLQSQSQVSLILIVAFIVIFLMQMSIIVLLNRTQSMPVNYPSNSYMGGMNSRGGEKSAETVAWLERRMHHLKDEMFMVETWLERLQKEYTWLKGQLKDVDKLEK